MSAAAVFQRVERGEPCPGFRHLPGSCCIARCDNCGVHHGRVIEVHAPLSERDARKIKRKWLGLRWWQRTTGAR